MLYVIETDAPCKSCRGEHGYVTQRCALAVFVDHGTAKWVARSIEGSAVRPIEKVPDGISYTLFLHKEGRPDEGFPKNAYALSSR